jgi:3-phosphoshikimate 1-carboxyvinyltransferase
MNLLLQTSNNDLQALSGLRDQRVKQTGYYCCKPCFQLLHLLILLILMTAEMQMALNGAEEVIDIHHAGTAMRFLTLQFKRNRTVTLTGSSRMQERPIKF